VCWHCGRKGHIQRNCFKCKDGRNYGNARGFIKGSRYYQTPNTNSVPEAIEGSSQADLAVVRALTATLSFVHHQQSYHTQSSESLLNSDRNSNWIIDSGASHHLTADQRLFLALQPLKEEITVTVGNGQSIKAVGTGKVHFELPFGPRFSIDALYVPGISRLLLSVSQLNCTVPLIFQNGHCYSGGRRIGILRNGLH